MIAAPNMHHGGITLDIEPMLQNVVSSAKGVVDIYRGIQALKVISEAVRYVKIDESKVDHVEAALEELDDTINDLEAKIQTVSFIRSILLKIALTHILNMQFTLSNKLSDYRVENNL